MYHIDYGRLSREERQRRRQLSPEARRAVEQGERASRRAARRERDMAFRAIQQEQDPARKQALIDALSPENRQVWNQRQAAGAIVRQTAATATQEGGAQTLLEQGEAATTGRVTNWVEQNTGIRLQLPGIRTTPQGGRWLNPDQWRSRNLKRIFEKGKKAAPGTVFFPKSRGLDTPVNQALDNLNAIKANLDAVQRRLPQRPDLQRTYNTRVRQYLEAASGVLRNAVYASGSKEGQAVDEFGAVVIYSFTTRNIKIPANSVGFVIKGGGSYIKWLKRKAAELRTQADQGGAAAAVATVQRGLQRGTTAVQQQAQKAGGGGLLLLGAVAVVGGFAYTRMRKKG